MIRWSRSRNGGAAATGVERVRSDGNASVLIEDSDDSTPSEDNIVPEINNVPSTSGPLLRKITN